MSASPVLTIHTDGASRGNPGAAAYAYVIEPPGQPPIEEADCLGRMTNNQAEYTALLRALEHALEIDTKHAVIVHSDSELMVKQLNGEYRVKNEELRPLFEEIQALRKEFPRGVQIRHVRREQNRRADALCNEALDGLRLSSRVRLNAASPPRPTKPPSTVQEEALACLRAAAVAWARGNPEDPRPEDIWRQLSESIRKGV